MRTGIGALAAALILVGGCGTLQGARDALNEKPQLPVSPTNIAIAEALLPNLANLGYALSLDGMPDCSDYKGFSPIEAANAFKKKCAPMAATVPDDASADIYLDRTVFVIDAYCDGYLNSLSQLGASSKWNRSQFNTIANYVGVLMSIAGQSVETLGYLNAGTAFFNASAENLDSLVLISATPTKLTPLVQSAMKAKLEKLGGVRQADSRMTWSARSGWIQEYAALCTPRGIRLLLDNAIDQQAPGDTPVELSNAAKIFGPGVSYRLYEMVPKDGAKPTWDVDFNSPMVLGAIGWLITDDTVNGLRTEEITVDGHKTDAKTAERDFITAKLGLPLFEFITAALRDPEKKQKLIAAVGGQGNNAFAEFIRNTKLAFAAQNAINEATAAKSEADKARQKAAKAESDKDDASETAQAAINQAEAAKAAQSQALVAAATARSEAELAKTQAAEALAAADVARQQAESAKAEADAAKQALDQYKADHPGT